MSVFDIHFVVSVVKKVSLSDRRKGNERVLWYIIPSFPALESEISVAHTVHRD